MGVWGFAVGESGRARRVRRDRNLAVGLAAALATGVLTLGLGLSGAVAAPWPAPVSVWGCGVCALILLAATATAVAGDVGAARPPGGPVGVTAGLLVLVGVAGLWLCVMLAGVIAVGEPGAVLIALISVATALGFATRLVRVLTTRGQTAGAGGRR